jgi:hypothetical protein
VVRQELERGRRAVVLQAVHLEAALVVNVYILLLRRRKELLAVQEGHGTCCFRDLDFRHQPPPLPLQQGEVPAAAAEQQVAPRARERARVGAELRQGQVKRLGRGARGRCGGDVLLLEAPRLLRAWCV